jgi:hypothetical protein
MWIRIRNTAFFMLQSALVQGSSKTTCNDLFWIRIPDLSLWIVLDPDQIQTLPVSCNQDIYFRKKIQTSVFYWACSRIFKAILQEVSYVRNYGPF